MDKLRIHKHLLENIEYFEEQESWLFVNGFKREARVVRGGVVALAEATLLLGKTGELSTSDWVVIIETNDIAIQIHDLIIHSLRTSNYGTSIN